MRKLTVSCCWVPKRNDAEWSESCMPRCNILKNGYLPEKKGENLYGRLSELLLSPKEGWRRMKWKLYAKLQRPEKRASPWEKVWSLLPEGKCAVAESQKEMMQDEVEIVCRCLTPNGHLFVRKGWALYQRVNELVLNTKEGWHRDWE